MAEPPLRVLLVEDNPNDTKLIREALTAQLELPIDLVLVHDFASGLRRLAHGGVDLVLLDLMLPDSQGLDTLIRMRREAPQVPIVVLTAFDNTTLGLEALQHGAQDYLVKGYIEVYPSLLGRSIRYTIERKRAARELLRLASFAEQDPNPIIETDSAGAVTYCNPSASKQFPDLATLGIRHPALQDIPQVVATLDAEAKPFLVREIVCGHNKMYEQHLYIPARGVVRSYSIEITERKQLERLKDEFLSTVSHELRTPMATVKEFIGIITDGVAGPLTPEQRQYLGTVRENIDRLARIINDLLDMAKIEAGRLLLTKTLLEPATLLEHVCASLRPLAQNKGLTLATRLPATLPSLFADSDKVTQILINLVSNAIKFTEPGGRVELALTEAPSEVIFAVTDTGVGIPAEEIPKLFEKFYQLAPRPLPGGTSLRGTGLGLAISKRLVELHGGTIGVTSAPGAGSTFTFTLPKHQVDGALPLRKPRVLVVDDEPKIRKFMRGALERYDYEVLTASTGEQALAILRGKPADLILLDLMMPGIDGYEVDRQLKADPTLKDIPVIIVTAKGERKDQQRDVQHVAYNYVAKPFDLEDLLARIRDTLVRSRAGKG